MTPQDQLLASITAFEVRAHDATARGAEAFARLLDLAEQRDAGQIVRIARFIAGTYNGHAFPFDLFELRAVDAEIADDMLACLDALRWAQADLHRLVPDGEARVKVVIERWGLHWPAHA
jgi:hypothetical protein